MAIGRIKSFRVRRVVSCMQDALAFLGGVQGFFRIKFLMKINCEKGIIRGSIYARAITEEVRLWIEKQGACLQP